MFSSAVAVAAKYNRGSKGLGIDKLEVGPEFLSPAHDLLIHLSSSDTENIDRTVLPWKMRLQAR